MKKLICTLGIIFGVAQVWACELGHAWQEDETVLSPAKISAETGGRLVVGKGGISVDQFLKFDPDEVAAANFKDIVFNNVAFTEECCEPLSMIPYSWQHLTFNTCANTGDMIDNMRMDGILGNKYMYIYDCDLPDDERNWLMRYEFLTCEISPNKQSDAVEATL